jgi:hypothetical protein
MLSGDAALLGVVESIANHLQPVSELPREEHSDWREEIIIAYCSGKGKFSQDTQFISLQLDTFDLHGLWIGYQQGVHQSESTAADLFNVPPMPEGPANEPHGPVPHLWTKGVGIKRERSMWCWSISRSISSADMERPLWRAAPRWVWVS